MTGRKSILLLFVLIALAGYAAWVIDSKQRGESPYSPPSDASPLFHAFYRHFADKSGGVYTNLRNDIPKVPGTATSHQMLSESTGLLMLYALHTHDQKLFDWQNAFLQRQLLADNGLIRWMIDPDDKKNDAHANASVDDIRIISALRQADREWGNVDSSYLRESERIASALLEYNVQDGLLLTDYYDWKSRKQSDTVTISYLDLQTLQQLAEDDKRWQEVAEFSKRLLQEGALPNGLFRKTFNWKSRSWEEPEEIHLVDTLYCAYHLAEVGVSVKPTVAFIEEQMKSKGKLNGRFRLNGQALGDIESPAVYARAIQLLELAGGDRRTADMLRKRLAAMAVTDPASPYYGAFIQLPAREGYSFDHLEALLTE